MKDLLGPGMRLRNLALTLAGLVSLALGMIGVVVPGLPTTPFLILASVLFCKSHPGLYRWLIEHPRFGEGIRRFNEERIIPVRVKTLALSMMTLMIGVSVMFFIHSPWGRAGVVLLGIIGCWVVLSFPSKPVR